MATKLLPADETFFILRENAFKEKIVYTDSSFTAVFGLTLLLGNGDKCLIKPASILISESTAVKLFGNNWRQQKILGETLSLDDRIPMTITGVFNDFPRHSHFTSNLFASVPPGFEDWIGDKSKVYTYVLLNKHANADNLTKKIQSFAGKFNLNEEDGNTRTNLQGIASIHLFSSYENENAVVGNIKNIYALLLVGFFLIVITVSNFVNLYTASTLSQK